MKISQSTFTLPALGRGIHIITQTVEEHLPPLPRRGYVNLFVRHTSCALGIVENSDPRSLADTAGALRRIAPDDAPAYTHILEGPDDMSAHIKSTLVGVSIDLPVADGRLALGQWQDIALFECRYDGGARKMVATVVGEDGE